jgi:hypothetical protein
VTVFFLPQPRATGGGCNIVTSTDLQFSVVQNGAYSCSVLRGLSVIDPCPVNTNILVPKVGALQMDVRNEISVFSETPQQQFMEDMALSVTV